MKLGFRKSGVCNECVFFINSELYAGLTQNIVDAYKIEHPGASEVDLILGSYDHCKLLTTLYHQQHHDIDLALEAIQMGAENAT